MYGVRNIMKTFGQELVLKGVTLEIEQNKTTVLIGPSGSGKTTLLRCISLLEMPDGGVVELGGHAYEFGRGKRLQAGDAALCEARRETGMVFQNVQLFPHKTAIENILEGPLIVDRLDKESCVQIALELLHKVGLEEKRNAYPYELSNGQRQLVAIARALAMHPQVLLLDEPAGVPDIGPEAEVFDIVRQLIEEKQTLLLVTHRIDFAREVADKLVFFDNGSILKQGTYKELSDSGDPCITRFFGKWNEKGNFTGL